MKKILAIPTNKKVISTIQETCIEYSTYFDAGFCSDTQEAISFTSYELPEIKVLDFTSEGIDCHQILSVISSDPWLHNGGIIAIVNKQSDVQEIEMKKDPNILIVQTLPAFCNDFSRIIRMLWNNQQFLFNRGMQEQLHGSESGSFICENDPRDIRMYASFLVNYLYSTNRVSYDDRFGLQTALMELLTNALEHGNCDISFTEKTAWLFSGRDMLDLIKEKNKNPEIAAKRIHISYLITSEKSYFKIKDEGKGFDWRYQMTREEDETQLHGRGIMLSQGLVSNIKYNDRGNQVSFEMANIQHHSNTIPGIMETFEMIHFTDKQVVCRQNEPSNDLYFIVSGRYAVYADKKLVSVLTPNDMFIGEMAFLLNDRRSATILAAGNGKLLRIPKTSFLVLIRKNPHYGIFLSKLLAQRLVRQTQKTIKLSSKLGELKNLMEIPDTI